MTLIAAVSRFVRRYAFSPEILVLCVLLFLLYNSGRLHVEPLRKYLEKARIKLQLRWAGQYDQISEESEKEVTEKKSKASWELRKGNVAIYAIQGRRPHMEDRYNFVNNLDETRTSIYGIFDGHGGEVRISRKRNLYIFFIFILAMFIFFPLSKKKKQT